MAGLASAISGALLAVSVNYLKDVHNNLLLFYTGVGGLLCTFVLIGIDTKSQIFYDPYHVEWGHLAIIGTINFKLFESKWRSIFIKFKWGYTL